MDRPFQDLWYIFHSAWHLSLRGWLSLFGLSPNFKSGEIEDASKDRPASKAFARLAGMSSSGYLPRHFAGKATRSRLPVVQDLTVAWTFASIKRANSRWSNANTGRQGKWASPIARELLGAVTSEGAQFGIVVTSGDFTKEARDFAASNPIRLMDGQQLARLISDLTGKVEAPASAAPPVRETETPRCPTCQSVMVLRTAKKGPNTGSQFWGYSRYPQCKGTRVSSCGLS